MAITEAGLVAIATGLSGVLLWAAVSDHRVRRIPNIAVAAVLVLFVAWTALRGGAGLISSTEGALAAFGLTFALYAFGVVGAGDAKLFSALALFAGMQHLALLTVTTALAGGVMGAVSLASRPTRAMVLINMRGKGDFGRGVPYGVAIAAGGWVMVWLSLSDLYPLPWSGVARGMDMGLPL